MDPLAALHLINDLIFQGEIEEAKDVSDGLSRWLLGGGFYPTLNSDDQKMVIMALINAIFLTEY